ncbi:histidine kinase dimerization/phospho-acceptor domain-containing protein [Bacillus mycoides]|uniref:histidine kinase dimerization/phospho-acceptor domain-containing protein n=1 Tax=Bacillus mycoides TaxID=1405 RepID=UPI0011AA67D3|nr:histidine kinase dimerization/phospho-acceptor domain-containing protein [Bacillus mycoides]
MLVYHLFWNQKGKRSPKLNSAIFIILCCLATILCITFAAKTNYGFQFDMRHIVLIVGTLTGGPIAGASILAVLNIYRFLLGGIGVFPSFIASVLLFIVLLLTYKLFNRSSNRIKIALAIFYSLIFGFGWIPFFLSEVTNTADYIPHIIVYELCTMLGTILILYLLHILQTQVRLQNELMNAEKFHLIGEMAASISHEIRNPLTSTKGFLQLLQSDTCSEKERKLYTEIAINGIEQANHVLTDYLTFAKPSIEKEQQLQVENELLHAVSLITPLANLTNVRIHYIKQSTAFFIAGEKQKFNQCLLNILKNCIEAMPKGGDLILTLVPDHKFIQLYIKDTGVGMDSEQVKRLGSPFYSTKEKGTGTTFLLTFPLIQKT